MLTATHRRDGNPPPAIGFSMKLGDLIKTVDTVEVEADIETEITGVSCDSSAIRQGEVFIAIEGYTTDGHNYIEDAVKRGAVCVICQKTPSVLTPYIKVKNTRKAFSSVSAAWFDNPSSKLNLIGVTGTNGKTTVTYLIKFIIENCTDSKVGLIGTISNLIGEREIASSLTTPDSYELMSIFRKMVFEGCKHTVMEVSSHSLTLDRVYGIEYELGIFTNLTRDHLDFHSSMDEYAQAKAILFQNSRKSLINLDDKYSELMIKNSAGSVMTYAIDNTVADITANSIRLSPNKTEFDINYDKATARCSINIPGKFSVYNALAATAAGLLLGYELDDIVKALQRFPGVKGRAEVVPVNTGYTVIVDYAHTPDALENIIRTARSATTGRVHTLFGCGGDRDREKRTIMGKLAEELSDFVTVTSDNPRTENPCEIIDEIIGGIADADKLQEGGKLRIIENRREAISRALDGLDTQDVLIIAGKGHETYQILGTEKIHFDDREVVYEHLRHTAECKRKLRENTESSDIEWLGTRKG